MVPVSMAGITNLTEKFACDVHCCSFCKASWPVNWTDNSHLAKQTVAGQTNTLIIQIVLMWIKKWRNTFPVMDAMWNKQCNAMCDLSLMQLEVTKLWFVLFWSGSFLWRELLTLLVFHFLLPPNPFLICAHPWWSAGHNPQTKLCKTMSQDGWPLSNTESFKYKLDLHWFRKHYDN